MTEEIKNKIAQDLKNRNMRQIDIAKKYGISQSAVSAIKREFKIKDKCTPDEVERKKIDSEIIYDIINSNMTIRQIARKYNTSDAYIANIKYDILNKFNSGNNGIDEFDTNNKTITITPKTEELENLIDEFVKGARAIINSIELANACQGFSTLSGLNVDYSIFIDDSNNVIFNNTSYIRIYNDKFNIIYHRFNIDDKEYVEKGSI